MFSDTFKLKVQEGGKPCANFKTDAFFASNKNTTSSTKDPQTSSATAEVPPRLLSDQMINNFFQEWAPLFPVLHRPTFLDTYTNYVSSSERMQNQHAVAQLNLVFGIAALSTEVCPPHTLPLPKLTPVIVE